MGFNTLLRKNGKLARSPAGSLKIDSIQCRQECDCLGHCCLCVDCCYGRQDYLVATLSFVRIPQCVCFDFGVCCTAFTGVALQKEAVYVFCGCGECGTCDEYCAVFIRADLVGSWVNGVCTDVHYPDQCDTVDPTTPGDVDMPMWIQRCCQDGTWAAIYSDIGDSRCKYPCSVGVGLVTHPCDPQACIDCILIPPIVTQCCLHGPTPNGCSGGAIKGVLNIANPVATGNCDCITLLALKTLSFTVYTLSCGSVNVPGTGTVSCIPLL